MPDAHHCKFIQCHQAKQDFLCVFGSHPFTINGIHHIALFAAGPSREQFLLVKFIILRNYFVLLKDTALLLPAGLIYSHHPSISCHFSTYLPPTLMGTQIPGQHLVVLACLHRSD
jgi:hypothetical protein